MAIITCSVGENGNLTPLTVQFESGDLLDLGQGQAGELVEVRGPFGLAAIVANSGQLTPPVRNTLPAPKLPPPPPEDGASKRSHQASNPIKIVLGATS
jgi:hypothetical protein